VIAGPRYLAPGDHARMRAAMTRLAQLHRALADVPLTPGEAWLHARVAQIRTGPPGVEQVLSRIDQLLPPATTTQWVHGDYHLSNLLWSHDEVSGVVDFDDVARGSAALEAGMALFALARQPAGEEAFVYDAALWDVGRAAYDGPVEGGALLFCAYQVLIHLDGAQRGLWELTEGIGFWPCWNTLMRA
jgi:aminoglycoside phosphotransferase (APT) family kinase protein